MKNNKIIRFLTATSLCDGHDVTIQIIRRILHEFGAEVIHLGHNRSVSDIINTAIQEDVDGIAVSSYQGGHVEYFTYIIDSLKKYNAQHIKVFGGGGGVISPAEIELLEKKGVQKIFTPHDGSIMGFSGMIKMMLNACKNNNYIQNTKAIISNYTSNNNIYPISKYISLIEESKNNNIYNDFKNNMLKIIEEKSSFNLLNNIPVIGFTGTGGSGKSSLIDEIMTRFLKKYPKKNIAVLSIDPTRIKTGGALLGDRIRMNAASNKRIFMRSMATRGNSSSISSSVLETINILKKTGFDLIIIETAGIGQGNTEIFNLADICIYIMTHEYGASSQLEKISMFDYTDFIALNKSDKRGSKDALIDIQKAYRRIHKYFDKELNDMPVFSTNTRCFNNIGINNLFNAIFNKISQQSKYSLNWPFNKIKSSNISIEYKNNNDNNYLKNIVSCIRKYKEDIKKESNFLNYVQSYNIIIEKETTAIEINNTILYNLRKQFNKLYDKISISNRNILDNYNSLKTKYASKTQVYKVRQKKIYVNNFTKSMSNNEIPKVILPKLTSWGDIVNFFKMENIPGYFPYTAGIFPFKRQEEAPTRMFAGEGLPETTNKKFHFLGNKELFTRLSTAFDSLTLYGYNPNKEMDIYGKIGNSGVSVCSLNDVKRLYSGINLSHKNTSVSMTINGPAPIMLAYFFNTAIDNECERRLKESGQWNNVQKTINEWNKKNKLITPIYRKDIPDGHDGFGLGFLGVSSCQIVSKEFYTNTKKYVLNNIRGTIQSDILKEDQAQNTCIFSIEFALKMMADVQKYFIHKQIKNFYSVSISGYHIAEAGANPITQLAFTMANGFTLAEYYISHGMLIDDFVHNFSFFFSNGLDIEYTVIGRVARRIWAIALKYIYNANERSQKLKYHIQTSGRSLHAQEMNFNDIRTTLQAYTAIVDNCNSLHTCAYDEALTTPTEESVRRALAIQMIINKELGIIKNENILQGSFIIDYLTNLIEEKVLNIFEELNERGGVIGAMDLMYQRNKIQEESMKYEHAKYSGETPIVGVNIFQNTNINNEYPELIRSKDYEKDMQVEQIKLFDNYMPIEQEKSIKKLQESAIKGNNIFESIMEASKFCTLGKITQALYEVGGSYRRNM